MWSLWDRGEIERSAKVDEPRLASWERADHPQQVRLRRYVDGVPDALGPLPTEESLYLDTTVDVVDSVRLHTHHDLENYLTPIFGSRGLAARRFVLVRAIKRVGGGSSIGWGMALPAKTPKIDDGWHHHSTRTSVSAGRPEWKQQVRESLEAAEPTPLPPGPASVRLAWQCSPERNWPT